MSDTPRTDAVLKELSTMKIRYNAWSDASFISVYARQLERELAAAKADTARLNWLLQDAELNLFFVDRDEIDAAMKEASK